MAASSRRSGPTSSAACSTTTAAACSSAGVDYDADTLWHDYRLGSLWGVVMTVIATILAAQTERGDEMLTVMAQRHGRHALDLEARGALG